VRIEREGAHITRCTLSVAQLPQLGPPAPPRAALAALLSLAAEEVCDGAQAWSCGLPFLVVPLADVAALARCRADVAALESTLADYPTRKVYPVAHLGANRCRVRMFASGAGVPEDPATGSAAAAFAGWLAERSPHAPGTQRFALEQGIEMGRPSRLDLEFDRTAEGVAAARVGGACVMVTERSLSL
jgi:trans-2,3-dihydro-3-hydroxyanthranilate isomerase